MPPKFISDQDFTPDSPPKFVSDADFQPDAAPTLPKPISAGHALNRSLAQGLTLGFADELAGASRAVGDKLSGSDTPLFDAYVKHRDAYRAADKAAKTAHPYVYAAGNIGGSIPAFLLGGEIPAIAKLGPVTRAAVEAGTMGLGNSDADLTKGQVGQAALDTGKSAALGAGFAKAGEMAAPYIQSAANKLGVAALGPRLRDVRRMIGTDKVDEMGQALHDAGVITPLSSAEGLYGKLADKTGELGGQIEGAISENAATPVAETQGFTSALNDNLNSSLGNVEGGAAAIDKTNNYVGDLLNKQSVPQGDTTLLGASTPSSTVNLDGAWKARKAIDSSIDFEKAAADRTPFEQGLTTARNKLQQAIQGALPEEAQPLARQYHLLESAEGMAKDKAAREFTNRAVSPSDYMSGAAGLVTGGPQGAIITGTLNHIARVRGGSTAAWGLDRLSNILAENPARFGPYAAPLLNAAKRGTQALAATHYILSQDSPTYRQMMEDIGKSQPLQHLQ